ncbi:MAG: MFS transporter [Lachnospiraceae bacterium]|nr:MFS transporter [Lachnospiraceae bacterium]
MKLVGDGKKGTLAFAIGQASVSLSYVIIAQLTYALTSSAGMAAGTVGALLMGSKIFDGITDLIAGYVIDRTNLRLGKARPFDLMSIPLWLLLIACFSVPGFSNFGKILWVLLTFNLCQSICYTFCSVSSTVRAKRSFVKEVRAKAFSACGIVGALLATMVSVILPLLIDKFENLPHGWTIITTIFAVPGMIMSLVMFLALPEMDSREIDGEAGDEHKLSFKDATKYFFQNKYALILLAVIMVAAIASVIAGTATTYYFKYYIGNLSMQSIVSLASVLGFFFLIFIPMLEKKTSHKMIFIVAFSLVAIGGLGRYINGKNIVILIIFGTLFGIGNTVIQTVRGMALIDCMSYGRKKFGEESEGIYSAVNGFADKIANGLGALIAGIILEIGHWDASLLTQPQSALTAIQFMYSGIPLILGIVGIIITMFFNVEKEI